MKSFGHAAVSEYLGDMVVYRSLNPCDARLPSLDQVRGEVDLPAGVIPRKSEKDYARVIAHLLRRARELDLPGGVIERLLYIGDTQMLDGTAFNNICQVGGWPGIAFIGSEDGSPPEVKLAATPSGGTLYLANRWSFLYEVDAYCTSLGMPVDESTAVVIDLDKTALGARGRNAGAIDRVRMQAVESTVAHLLGEDFDLGAFQNSYGRLNQVAYHPFTSDNQDYLAYICLILGSELYNLGEVESRVQSGDLTSFSAFITGVDTRRSGLSPKLSTMHDEIFSLVLAGDPTPFKKFRHNEYLLTVQAMGFLDDGYPVERLLAEEICLTQEVRAQALEWRERGALISSLSDKPDEDSVHSAELAARGYLPIHRVASHAVGSS